MTQKLTLMGSFPKEIKIYVHIKTHTLMLIEALFITAKNANNPDVPQRMNGTKLNHTCRGILLRKEGTLHTCSGLQSHAEREKSQSQRLLTARFPVCIITENTKLLRWTTDQRLRTWGSGARKGCRRLLTLGTFAS